MPISEAQLTAWDHDPQTADVHQLIAEVRRLRQALRTIRDSECQDSETEICWCYDRSAQALGES